MSVEAVRHIEFEQYPDTDLPIPRPWTVASDGRIISDATNGLGMRLVAVEGSKAVISIGDCQYVFPQKIVSISEVRDAER